MQFLPRYCPAITKRYYYDGVNEVYEYDAGGDPLRYFVRGASYIDERLATVNCYETTGTTDDRPFYYVIDRQYNVKFIVDRAGAIVERYAYDPYGKPLIRESIGRGDFDANTIFYNTDAPDMADAVSATIWDARADIDDDGDADSADTTAYTAKDAIWPLPSYDQPTVSQAFSDVGNPYMFQGVPHFAIDTSSSATTVKFPLNHHRARFAEPITGRWVTRDPLGYNVQLAREVQESSWTSIKSTNKEESVADSHAQVEMVVDGGDAIADVSSDFAESNMGLSLYAQFGGNPTDHVDPTGLFWCWTYYNSGACGGTNNPVRSSKVEGRTCCPGGTVPAWAPAVGTWFTWPCPGPCPAGLTGPACIVVKTYTSPVTGVRSISITCAVGPC